MRALVTGGAGFVGSHLCDRLLAMGHRVYCADDLSSGRIDNLREIAGNPSFHLLQHNVTEALNLEVDAIFHLASPASPNPDSPISYRRNPVKTALANSLGTYQMLELTRRCGAAFLLASTSEVYGDPQEHPQREEYWGHVNPTGPRSCYDEGKRFAEALAMAYRQEYDLDVRIVRIFNTYGPRSHPLDGRLVPNLVQQALRGEPMTVHGDGQQTRSLCYVSDMVEGILLATFTPGTPGQVLNLGNPEEHSVLEYAVMIRELCGSDSPITYLPRAADDPFRRKPDIAKARDRLGWDPKVSLREGLARTIEWFRLQLPRKAS